MVKVVLKKRPHEESVAKGAMVNILGTIGKGMFPLFFIVVTRLYGPKIMGIYFLIYKILDITASLSVSGINDGILMFMSRDIDHHEKTEKKLYMMLANGFGLSLFITGVIIIIAYSGGLAFLKQTYPQEEVVNSLYYMVWVLPFAFIPIIIISATKSLLIMKYDALVIGFLRPFLFTLFAVVFYFYEVSLNSLLLGYFSTSIIVTIVCLFIFYKYFSYRKLLVSLFSFRLSKPLIAFAIPQSLNITFTTFITNLDVLMLGYFNFFPEMIGFYGMGAQIIKNLREVKLAFSGAYAPVIARLHAAKDYIQMNATYSMISRWTSTIGFPIALLMAIFREELLLVFHSSFTYDTSFMIMLLVPPLLACTIGLSLNILVMTGHSGWNLFNSILNTGLNGILNYIFIQKYGLMGAALATAIASLTTSIAIYYQVKVIEKATLVISKIYKPYVAILFPVIAFSLAEYYGFLSSFSIKLLFSGLFLLIYIAAMKLLEIEPEDKRLFSFKTK